jgi:foldase protein PrsA
MSVSLSTRRRCFALVLGAVLVPLAALPAPAGDGDAIVIVNGQPISKAQMTEVLFEAYGINIMQQLIALELAKQESRRLGLRISPADVDEEFRESLARIAPAVTATGQALDDQQKRQALDTLLQEKGISLAEFMIGMERNAHLRQIVEKDLTIDEATLREEFARTYDEKVEIRHIQCNDIASGQVAWNQVNGGSPFEDVARRLSQNPDSAARGGLLDPFTFSDAAIPALLREAAFSMKVGELSAPLRVDNRVHIIRVERRTPPENVRFEDVRADVERRVRARVTQLQMNQRIVGLFKKSQVRVLDAKLKARYDDLLKRNAAQPAATP